MEKEFVLFKGPSKAALIAVLRWCSDRGSNFWQIGVADFAVGAEFI